MHRQAAAVIGIATLALAISTTIDFATQDPDLLIAGDVANGYLGADVVLGDLDGDGIDDLVVGAPWAAGSGNQEFAGRIYIFFGGQDRPASISGSDADVTIVGSAFDYIGGGSDRVSGTMAIGNLDDDAFNDLALGVPDAQRRAGEVRILFGRSRSEWALTSIIDLTNLPGDVVITGADAFETMGSAVAVGDVNGDGRGDLIAGALRADVLGGSRTNAGRVYGFFGRASWPGVLQAQDDADFQIVGAEGWDFLGGGLAVGQLGGTEVADLAIGALGGGGQVHIVFGSTSLRGNRDLSSMPADWSVHAADSIDDVGRQIRVGDVNGDGRPDLVIGVPGGDGPASRRQDAGEVAVLFGSKAPGTTSDLADGADFALFGPQGLTAQQPGGRLGESMTLGDFNADGVLDVMAGSRFGDGFDSTRPEAGEAYVVFGGDLPPSVDLGATGADIAIFGRAGGDALSRVAAGNIDGVSPDDLTLGAFRADLTEGESLEKAGEVFVVYRQSVQPTPTSTVETPPAITPTPTRTTTLPNLSYLPLIMVHYGSSR